MEGTFKTCGNAEAGDRNDHLFCIGLNVLGGMRRKLEPTFS